MRARSVGRGGCVDVYVEMICVRCIYIFAEAAEDDDVNL